MIHRGGPYSTPPRGTILNDYVGEEKFSVTDRWLTAVPQTPLLTDPAAVTAERLCCRTVELTGQSKRWKMSKATFHSAVPGFLRSGSTVTKVCASATLNPPAISGSRCSVSSERATSKGGRAVS